MNQERLFKVLLGPHITEKSAMSSGAATQVVFKVATDASKLEVKKAVQQLFEVKVEAQCRVGAPQTADLPKPSGARWSGFERPMIAVAVSQDQVAYQHRGFAPYQALPAREGSA